MIEDPSFHNENLKLFNTHLNDYDGELKTKNDKDKRRRLLNDAFSKLSQKQQKIVKRTINLAFVNDDIQVISDKYLKEVNIILRADS